MSDSTETTDPPGAGDVVPAAPLAGSRAVEVIDHETGELVPAGESGIVFADVLDDSAVAEYMTDMDATSDESPEAIQLEIARRILAAPDEKSLWAATTVKSAKDVVNQPIEVQHVRWVKSAYAGGAPKFAIIDGTMVYGGDPVTVSCGGLNVVLTLYKLQKFGSLPAKIVIGSKPSGGDAGRVILTVTPFVVS
jgi:hypothetical protein